MDYQEDYNMRVALKKRPDETYPQQDVFQIIYNKPPLIQEVQENELLVKIKYISILASMRVWISGQRTYIDPVNPGDTMPAPCIAEILYSRSKKYSQGDLVLGFMRWERYMIIKDEKLNKIPKEYPNPSHFLGSLGNQGLTAYFGLNEIGKMKKGETVVISAAAGAVGQIAVQLAKLNDCKVIAIAGSEDKCAFIKNVLGADICLNYKDKNFLQNLKQSCKSGVDVYFDNVGGYILDQVLLYINDYSRVILCGAVSEYNNSKKEDTYAIKNYQRIIFKKSIMKGFIVFDYAKQYQKAIQELMGLALQGKLKCIEDILYGLDSAPRGLKKLIQGENLGQVVIYCDKETNSSKL